MSQNPHEQAVTQLQAVAELLAPAYEDADRFLAGGWVTENTDQSTSDTARSRFCRQWHKEQFVAYRSQHNNARGP